MNSLLILIFKLSCTIIPGKYYQRVKVYDNSWIKVTEFDVINPIGGKGIYGKFILKISQSEFSRSTTR